MVAHDVLRVVDHTTAIAGEQATGMNGVEITPWIDTVAAWHHASLSLAATGTAGEPRMIPHRSRSVPAACLKDGLEALAPVAGDRLAAQDADVTAQGSLRSQANIPMLEHPPVVGAPIPVTQSPRSRHGPPQLWPAHRARCA